MKNNTVEDLIIYGKKHISSTLAKILLADLIGKNPLELYFNLDLVIDSELAKSYKEKILQIKNNVPIQYILKKVNFYKQEFYVDDRVLIPRFETEELVDYTIKYLNNYFKSNIKILDLCCGSGVIGLSLKKFIPDSNVFLSDISKDALDVAKINKEKLNLDCELIESDLFSNINSKFDCIISNPPYIALTEKIDSLVKYNEPSIALYGGIDGLEFYRRILSNITNYLEDKYLIAFEIGMMQAKDIIEISKLYLNKCEVITQKDMQNRDRMLFFIKR